MKICAGDVFHQRKPTSAPTIARRDDREVERVAHVVALDGVRRDEVRRCAQDWIELPEAR